MGLLEIQVPARAPPACAALVGPCDTASAKPVRSLVVAPGPWLDNGSRMSREVHVRFCESGGVQFPSATHLVKLMADLGFRLDAHWPMNDQTVARSTPVRR